MCVRPKQRFDRGKKQPGQKRARAWLFGALFQPRRWSIAPVRANTARMESPCRHSLLFSEGLQGFDQLDLLLIGRQTCRFGQLLEPRVRERLQVLF